MERKFDVSFETMTVARENNGFLKRLSIQTQQKNTRINGFHGKPLC